MARNNELIRLAKKAAGTWRNTHEYQQAAQIIDMLVDELEKSTLTQPNEPLTWEELKQMAGEPVYIVEPKKSISSAYWVLIDEVDEKSMWCVVGIGSACLNFYKTYGKTWMEYRRPPDEAVDMVMERLEALRDE